MISFGIGNLAGRRARGGVVAALCLLFLSMGIPGFARVAELCFDASDTGLAKADFTLAYYYWDSAGAVAVATSGITVAHDADQPAGCYIFSGLSDADNLNFHFVATVTANGHYAETRFPMGGAAQGIAWTDTVIVPSSTTEYYKDATRPAYTLEVKPSLSQTPAGATVAFEMKRQGASTARVLTGTASAPTEVVDDGGSPAKYGCKLTFTWAAGDLDMDDCTQTTCIYNVRFIITYAPGEVHPLPVQKISVTVF